MSNTLREYIRTSWVKAVTEKKTGTLILPYPFVPPCVEGDFRVIYYWDTYFTNVGLIMDGKIKCAKYNVDNLLYSLDYFGCVPNYTQDEGAKWCSQPPLLRLMVEDVYKVIQDENWHHDALLKLEKEYAFWMKERISKIGLNQYGTNEKSEEELAWYYDTTVCSRLDVPKDISVAEKAQSARNFVAEAESGEDFTPRYRCHNALDYTQIDLNSHLYGLEDYLAHAYAGKDAEKSAYYARKREARLALIEQYCLDKRSGIYSDYDFVVQQRSDRICAACFLPYFYGFAKDGVGVKTIYKKLKTKGGVVACEDTGDYSYQWGYPNIWALHQYFAYVALKNYGHEEEATELRRAYMQNLEKEFAKTGNIWERYDENGIAKDLEYKTQPMLGWTAGVYNYFWKEEHDND